ncbi:hypothetical protein [Gemmatimonas sp.]|uniref:hypothetical protein n=1 Tax=Gemmatimonas sp. TaxID=1962908 RepID=UPI00286E16D4|nr:hypothetical protein [Gemmatimonas sp.]
MVELTHGLLGLVSVEVPRLKLRRRKTAQHALRDKPVFIVRGTADAMLGIHLARWSRRGFRLRSTSMTDLRRVGSR